MEQLFCFVGFALVLLTMMYRSKHPVEHSPNYSNSFLAGFLIGLIVLIFLFAKVGVK